MRFLAKRSDARAATLRYVEKGHNDGLLQALLDDQHRFCAYSECRVTDLHTAAVEHFDRSLKGTDADGPSNHYGVLQVVNQRKRRREREFEGASFFADRWFQVPGALAARLAFIPAFNAYDAVDPSDREALELAAYLGFDEPEVAQERAVHVGRLRVVRRCRVGSPAPARLASGSSRGRELPDRARGHPRSGPHPAHRRAGRVLNR